MKKHFVVFLSPGTFVSEQTSKAIDSWDVERAMEMAHEVRERHGATPYGFYFTTRERSEEELDSKESTRSGTYHLGGKIMTMEDVKREMPTEEILLSNMRGNKIEKIVVNTNSWRSITPFGEKDVMLDWHPRPCEETQAQA